MMGHASAPGELLEFDLESLDPRDRYFLMTASVIPRPIAWVSSQDRDGRRNLAPFSYFNMCSATPPIVHFTTTAGRKDSRDNVLATGEFVVNVVTPAVASAMRISSAAFPSDVDEFEMADVTPEASRRVAPPRVAEAAVALECRLRQSVQIGEGTMIFGDVIHLRVAPDVWRDGRIDPSLLQPLGRLSGMRYATVDDVYRLELPAGLEASVQDYAVHGGAPEEQQARSNP
jgi:flavin reductase (DIM6/NTAB) family NADH-FMN oxidoreductase RutF